MEIEGQGRGWTRVRRWRKVKKIRAGREGYKQMRSEEEVGKSKEQIGKHVLGKEEDGKRGMSMIGNGRDEKGWG
jgi:hypothetical protein